MILTIGVGRIGTNRNGRWEAQFGIKVVSVRTKIMELEIAKRY